VSIIYVEVFLKDKDSKVHIEHFFDIELLENVGYVIKTHLMLCSIHYFFEDPKVVVPKLIREFGRTTKVYYNELIGGYFAGQVLGIFVNLTAETIAQDIGCERWGT